MNLLNGYINKYVDWSPIETSSENKNQKKSCQIIHILFRFWCGLKTMSGSMKVRLYFVGAHGLVGDLGVLGVYCWLSGW